jgi:hypothetical protein
VQRAYSLSLAMGLTVILTTLALSAEMRLAPEPLSLRKVGRPWPRCRCLGVKGLPWSIAFGSPKIGSDVRFRNGADSHEAAAKESTYA